MKFIAVVASLATIAFAADSSVVTCPECKTPASTNDVVTREPIPTTSCDSPSLTVVKSGSASSTGGVNPGSSQSGGGGGGNPGSSQTGGQTGSPTSPPITAGAGRVAGGALAAVVAVVALL